MDDAEGWARVRVHGHTIMGARRIPEAVLAVELDLLDLAKTGQHPRSHLMQEVLDGFGDELVERRGHLLANLLTRDPLGEVAVPPVHVQVDEERPVGGLGKRRELVPHESGERAAAELDELEALPSGAVIDHALAAHDDPGCAAIRVRPLVEDGTAALEGELVPREPDLLHVLVALEEAAADVGEDVAALDHELELGREQVPVGVRPVDRDGVLPVMDLQRLCHRSSAIATSSSSPVPSSSARVRWSLSRRTETISPRGLRLTKTTKRKPNLSS